MRVGLRASTPLIPAPHCYGVRNPSRTSPAVEGPLWAQSCRSGLLASNICLRVVVYSVRVRTRKTAGESILVAAVFRRSKVFGFSRGQSIVEFPDRLDQVLADAAGPDEAEHGGAADIDLEAQQGVADEAGQHLWHH